MSPNSGCLLQYTTVTLQLTRGAPTGQRPGRWQHGRFIRRHFVGGRRLGAVVPGVAHVAHPGTGRTLAHGAVATCDPSVAEQGGRHKGERVGPQPTLWGRRRWPGGCVPLMLSAPCCSWSSGLPQQSRSTSRSTTSSTPARTTPRNRWRRTFLSRGRSIFSIRPRSRGRRTASASPATRTTHSSTPGRSSQRMARRMTPCGSLPRSSSRSAGRTRGRGGTRRSWRRPPHWRSTTPTRRANSIR